MSLARWNINQIQNNSQEVDGINKTDLPGFAKKVGKFQKQEMFFNWRIISI